MAEQMKAFEFTESLQNWCVILVIQELLTMFLGYGLLGKYQMCERIDRKMALVAFCPSFLVPVGILYMQMICFNHFLQLPFTGITLFLTLAVPAGILFTTEILRGMFSMESRILKGFSMEWILLMLAMFTPLAATADFTFSKDFSEGMELRPLGILMLPVLAGGLTIYLFKK